MNYRGAQKGYQLMDYKYVINPRIFLPKFRDVNHQHPTRFSKNSSHYKKSASKTTSFAVTPMTQLFGTVS